MNYIFAATFRTLPFLLIISILLLTSCLPKNTSIAIVDTNIKKPTIQYQMPPKQTLDTVEWDFPRTLKQIAILNKSKCRKAVKDMGLNPDGVFDPSGTELIHLKDYCKVPAIDNGSNLYIGLTEANYRSLVNNYNILMIREQRWIDLLNQINTQLKLQNEGN